MTTINTLTNMCNRIILDYCDENRFVDRDDVIELTNKINTKVLEQLKYNNEELISFKYRTISVANINVYIICIGIQDDFSVLYFKTFESNIIN